MFQLLQQWWLRREGRSTPSGGVGASHSRGQKKLSWITIALTILVVWGAQQLQLSQFVDDLELKTYDMRVFWQRGKLSRKPSNNIVLVTFDDATLNLFEDEFGTWPWNRQVSANMMTWLNGAGAKAVVFDVMFTHPKHGTDAAGDVALVSAFRRYRNVFIGMNTDNHYGELSALGKAPTVQQFITYGQRLGVALEPSPQWQRYWQENGLLTFNNARFLLPGLMAESGRVGVLNHFRDRDGVSRANPLFVQVAWKDATGRTQTTVYPYLAFRVWLNLLYPPQQFPQGPPPLVISEKGRRLQVGTHTVPLLPDGRFLVSWYNRNVDQDEAAVALKEIKKQLAALPNTPAVAKQRLRLEQQQSNMYGMALTKFSPKPYREISAWRVIQAFRSPSSGSAQALKAFFKDKVVFVGATALATYDIKTTPISPTLPGMTLQATLFDNLWQSAQHPNDTSVFVHKASAYTNLMATLVLSILCVMVIAYTPSVWLGIAGAVVVSVFYMLVAFGLFVVSNVWLSVAAPLATASVVVLFTYVLRYLSRTADLEVTYQLATTDAMTGLKNHRYFQEHLARSVDQAKRSGQPASLLMIDIDYFKKFNDTYGHQAGDRVLKAVAKKLEHTVRKSDLVARYGGEEMAVVLVDTDSESALQAAQKIVEAVASEPYPIAEGTYKHVTISLGVATCPDHGLEPTELISVADLGLYDAKEGGRNRVGLSAAHWDDFQRSAMRAAATH